MGTEENGREYENKGEKKKEKKIDTKNHRRNDKYKRREMEGKEQSFQRVESFFTVIVRVSGVGGGGVGGSDPNKEGGQASLCSSRTGYTCIFYFFLMNLIIFSKIKEKKDARFIIFS